MSKQVLLIFVFAPLLAACTTGGPIPNNPGHNPSPAQATPYTLTGRVTDAQGGPLAGAEVFADNTLYYNTNVIGITDAGGSYTIDVSQPDGSWHAGARLRREYHGFTYTFDLHPDNDAPFLGTEGAVRDFTWQLTGTTPTGDGYYGGTVITYADYTDYELLLEHVELTLTPTGPLVDGSTGQAITAKLVRTGDGDAIPDVPLGRYDITARYAPPDAAPTPLLIRLRDTGTYGQAVTADFGTPYGSELAIHWIEVQVARL